MNSNPMNQRTTKLMAKLFALLLVVSVFSSCNRGTGCPNNEFDAKPILTLPFLK